MSSPNNSITTNYLKTYLYILIFLCKIKRISFVFYKNSSRFMTENLHSLQMLLFSSFLPSHILQIMSYSPKFHEIFPRLYNQNLLQRIMCMLLSIVLHVSYFYSLLLSLRCYLFLRLLIHILSSLFSTFSLYCYMIAC